MVQESFDKGDDDEVLTVCTISSVDAWVIDFGASYHMTYNHDQFDSFKECNCTIKTGDNLVSSIKGNGTMQIKIYDGMVRKFDCWYVLELWNNLLSLGTLAQNGMRYVGEGDWVKVSKGSLMIMNGNMTLMGFISWMAVR